MRCLPLLGALFLATTSLAIAQLQISAQTRRTNFLLYERVDVYITLQNVGGTDLILDNNEGRPWLSFMVSRRENDNDFPVQEERQIKPAPLTLKVGESKTLKVNLTPLYAFRTEGDYRASAVIDLPGEGQIISEQTPFTVLRGHEVWNQVRSVDSSERTYSLIRFTPKVDSTQLYLRVEDTAENLVYANIALGEIVSSTDPQVYFDPAGNIHVLQPVALGTYLYSRADQDGKVMHQSVFKSAPMPGTGLDLVPPRLAKMDDGNVVVLGGLEQNANNKRERLSDSQGVSKPTAQIATPSPDMAQ